MSQYSAIPFYRTKITSPLKKFRVVYRESDLLILAKEDLSKEALEILRNIRAPLERYIQKNPLFLRSLVPLPEDDSAPPIVQTMLKASRTAGVGPMASVAGAIAQAVGVELIQTGLTEEIVVENGGDIFLALKKEAKVALYAGESPFSGKIALVIPSSLQPCGVCTSSGKIGHSLSFGKADAVTVVHKETATADALATAFGNLLKEEKDFNKIVEISKKIEDLYGVFAILGDKLFIQTKKIKIKSL